MRVDLAHSWQLTPTQLEAARDLLYDAFGDDPEEAMTEADWEHCLGGVHVLAWDGDLLVGHACVVQRRLLHGGRALRTAYVEGVAVRDTHRRRGVASALMAQVERVTPVYDVAALGSSDMALPFYLGRGWERWRGRLSALTPDGVAPTPDEEGWILVLPGEAPLDLEGELTCDWRPGDVW